MSENDMTELIEKYREGNTSLEEEKRIHDYMVGHPTHGYAPWFLGKESLRTEKSNLTIDEFRARTSRKATWHKRMQFRVAASILLLSAITILIVQRQYRKDVTVASSDMVQEITLPDGSLVTLNENTVVRYPGKFERSRDVWLEKGEAFFEVVTNPDLPFIVHCGATITKVTGTTFNVRSERGLTEVAVLSGRVAFGSSQTDSRSLTLMRGMAGEFNAQAKELKEIPTFDSNNIAWKTHRLEFKDAPLKSVVKTLENYFHVRIEAQDTSILTCSFRGVFEEANLNEIIQVMDYSMNIKLTSEGSVYTLSGRGCNH